MVDNFYNWFMMLPALEQVFWVCAMISSFFFVIQLLLTLIGMDSSDVCVDFDGPDTMDFGGGVSLFTVRAFVNFLLGFGWGGLSICQLTRNVLVIVLVALATGVLFVWVIRLLYKNVRHLEYNAAFNIDECVGKTATVYLRIPANNVGVGKVQISVRGSVHELDACSDGEFIPTGAKVRILEVIDKNILKVEKLNK